MAPIASPALHSEVRSGGSAVRAIGEISDEENRRPRWHRAALMAVTVAVVSVALRVNQARWRGRNSDTEADMNSDSIPDLQSRLNKIEAWYAYPNPVST